MVGFPKSGKSTFVDLMFQQHTELGFKSMVVVRPSDWYPPNIEKLPAQERTEYQIAAWEHALEKVTGLLPSLATDDAVVLDTCGTSPNSLNTMIGVAKAKQHKVVAIWIATPESICASRLGNAEIIKKYAGKIGDAIKSYQKSCAAIVVVRNNSVDEWRASIPGMAKRLWPHQ